MAEPVAGQLPADQLFRPDGDATLMIQAVDTGRDLAAFADDVRRLQDDNGLDTRGDAVRSPWRVSMRCSGMRPSVRPGTVRARTVIFERDGIAWRLEFADSAQAFDAHVGDLGLMLRSWRFR